MGKKETGGEGAGWMERESLFPIPEDYRFYPRPVSVMFGRGAYAPSVWTSDVGYGLFGGAAVGIVAAAATFFFATRVPETGGMLLHLGALAHALMPNSYGPELLDAWNAWREGAAPTGRGAAAAGALAALGFGAFAGRWSGKKFAWPRDGNMHVKGRRLLDGDLARKAFMLALKTEYGGKQSEMDIEMVPGIPMSADRMKKHGVFLGPPGSGKTVVQAPMIERAIRSGGRVLIFDIKGDFTELFYKETYDKNNPDTDEGRETKDNPVILLSPFDKRSFIWDIAADVRTKQDAKTFAEANIETSDKDPMWGNLARAVVVGCVHMLQCEKPGKWGFGDLAHLLGMNDMKSFVAIMKRYNEEGLRAVDTADDTAAGVMSNVMSGMQPLFDMADAWPSPIEGRMFSVRKWATAQGDDLRKMRKAVIIKGSPDYEGLTRACAGAIFQVAQAVLTSIPDDSSRAFYLLLDEFPTLGKVNITKLITLGRSKGVRVWLGMQTLNQFKAVHGEDVANTLKNSISTFVSLGAVGPEAEEVSNLIGDRTVERMVVTGSGQNASMSPQNTTMKTIDPSQVALVGEYKPHGVKMLIWGKGFTDAMLLHVPYPSMLKHALKKTARPNVIADWTKPEANRMLMDARAKRKVVMGAFLKEWSEKVGENYEELFEGKKAEQAGPKNPVPVPKPPAPAPNCDDPTKPFVSSNPDNPEVTRKERMRWAALMIKEQNKRMGEEGPKDDDEDDETRLERDEFRGRRADIDESRNRGAGGRGANALVRDSARAIARITAETDPEALQALADEAERRGDDAALAAARTRLAGGHAKVMLAGGSRGSKTGSQSGSGPRRAADAQGRKEVWVQDAPTYVRTGAAEQRAERARDSKAEDEDNPLTEGIESKAQIELAASVLGMPLAELIVHAVEAADKSAPGPGPDVLVIPSQPRRVS
jgi:hypothetical protein